MRDKFHDLAAIQNLGSHGIEQNAAALKPLARRIDRAASSKRAINAGK
ncbi:MAG: hypothetical protein V8R44_01335 [Eggerthellaceae bacterium]